MLGAHYQNLLMIQKPQYQLISRVCVFMQDILETFIFK